MATKVGGSGAGGVPGLNLEQMLNRMGSLGRQASPVPELMAPPDPRESVQGLVDRQFEAYNPSLRNPGILAAQEAMDSMAQAGGIRTPRDIAEVSGVAYAPESMMELGENGIPREVPIDPAAVESEFAGRLSGYKAAADAFVGGMRASELEDLSGRDIIGGVMDASFSSDLGEPQARRMEKNKEFFANDAVTGDQVIDRRAIGRHTDANGIALESVTRSMFPRFFHPEESVNVETETTGGILQMPIGHAIAFYAAGGNATTDPDPDQMMEWADRYGPAVATLAGLSVYKAASQTKLHKEDGIYEDTNGLLDANSLLMSIKHFMQNGLDRNGIRVPPGTAEKAAQAAFAVAQSSGTFIPWKSPEGKVFYLASPATKEVARSMSRFNEAVLGDRSRRGYSTVPTATGVSIESGRTGMTRLAVRVNGMITTAADATKNILGNMPLGFDTDDVTRVEIQLNDIAETIQKPQGFSTSVWADRYKMGEKAYRALRLSYDPPEKIRLEGEEAVELARDKHAQTAMKERLSSYMYDLQNAGSIVEKIVYSEWLHSPSNQRFYSASSFLDYMGSKTIIRDMLSIKTGETTNSRSLFGSPSATAPGGRDLSEINRIKQAVIEALTKPGREGQKAFERMNPADLSAAGTMYNAVIHYYTVFSPLNEAKDDIRKIRPADVIDLYTPAIGTKLAAVGARYNNWLKDPVGTQEADPELIGLMAAIEPGESKGAVNLWQDFAALKANSMNSQTASLTVPLTHHSFADGNQNGIFIQSLVFAGGDSSQARNNAIRLGAYSAVSKGQNTSQYADLRVFATNSTVESLLRWFDNSSELRGTEKRDAWTHFFRVMEERMGSEGLAKALMKIPIMQASYGKDAAMFYEHVRTFLLESLSDTGSKAEQENNDLIEHFKAAGYSVDDGLGQLANELNMHVASQLRASLASNYVSALKNVGWYHAMMASTPTIEGASGDSLILGPVGLVPKEASELGNMAYWKKDTGKYGAVHILYDKRQAQTEIQVDGATIGVPNAASMGLTPGAAKAPQKFWDTAKKKMVQHINYAGSALSNMMAVMLIQSMDGDGVKMATLFGNQDRKGKVPRGVLWVHDASITTAGAGLVYRNAYNNYAMNDMEGYMSGLGKLLDDNIRETEKALKERLTAPGASPYVGIGENGEFAAVGGYFDKLYNAVLDPNSTYKEFWYHKNSVTKTAAELDAAWKKKEDRARKLIGEATQYGYMDPKARSEALTAEESANYAVLANRYFDLLNLAKTDMGISGPESKWAPLVANWASNVKAQFKNLRTKVGRHGLAQLTPTGGSPGISADAILAKREEQLLKQIAIATKELQGAQKTMTEAEANQRSPNQEVPPMPDMQATRKRNKPDFDTF